MMRYAGCARIAHVNLRQLSVLNYVSELLGRSEAEPVADPNASYYLALDRLTAKDWLRSG